jgi:hypothetical protein
VSSYAVEGLSGDTWRPLSTGTTIGYRKLDRCEPLEVSRVRVRIEVVEGPARAVGVRLFGGA